MKEKRTNTIEMSVYIVQYLKVLHIKIFFGEPDIIKFTSCPVDYVNHGFI